MVTDQASNMVKIPELKSGLNIRAPAGPNITSVIKIEQVVERALGSVEGLAGGSGGYNVVTNNCEHFASWAR